MIQRLLLTTIAGFVTMFITNGIMAAGVIGPLFEDSYKHIVAEASNFPLLILGYLIISLAMSLIYFRLLPTDNWFSQSTTIGILLGLAIFLGTHTVIAGYTTLDATGFVMSGLFDSLGPMIGMVSIGFVTHRLQQREAVSR